MTESRHHHATTDEVSIVGIALVAEHFDEQVAFYRDVLGMRQLDDWGDAVRLASANGVELTIFAQSHDARSVERLRPRLSGLSHLEFGVEPEIRRRYESHLRGMGRESHNDNFLDRDGQLFHFVSLRQQPNE